MQKLWFFPGSPGFSKIRHVEDKLLGSRAYDPAVVPDSELHNHGLSDIKLLGRGDREH